jgi:hypothetical protein
MSVSRRKSRGTALTELRARGPREEDDEFIDLPGPSTTVSDIREGIRAAQQRIAFQQTASAVLPENYEVQNPRLQSIQNRIRQIQQQTEEAKRLRISLQTQTLPMKYSEGQLQAMTPHQRRIAKREMRLEQLKFQREQLAMGIIPTGQRTTITPMKRQAEAISELAPASQRPSPIVPATPASVEASRTARTPSQQASIDRGRLLLSIRRQTGINPTLARTRSPIVEATNSTFMAAQSNEHPASNPYGSPTREVGQPVSPQDVARVLFPQATPDAAVALLRQGGPVGTPPTPPPPLTPSARPRDLEEQRNRLLNVREQMRDVDTEFYYRNYMRANNLFERDIRDRPGRTLRERFGITRQSVADRLFRRDLNARARADGIDPETMQNMRLQADYLFNLNRAGRAQFYRETGALARRADPVTQAIRPAQSARIGAYARERYLLPDGSLLTTSDHDRLRDRMVNRGVNITEQRSPRTGEVRYVDTNTGNRVYINAEQYARLQTELQNNPRYARRQQAGQQRAAGQPQQNALDKAVSAYRWTKQLPGGTLGKVIGQARDIRNFYSAVKNARKNGEITYNSWKRFTDTMQGRTRVRDGVFERKKDRFSSLGQSLDSLSDIYLSGADALDNTAAYIDSFINPVANTIARWNPAAAQGRHGWMLNPLQYYFGGRRVARGIEKSLKGLHLTSNEKFDADLFRRGLVESMVGAGRMTRYGDLFDAWEDITGIPFEDTLEGVGRTADSLGLLGLKAGATALYSVVMPGKTNMFAGDLRNQWDDFANQMVSNWESVKDTVMSVPTNVFTNLIPVIPIYNQTKEVIDWIKEHPRIEDWFSAGYDSVQDGLKKLQGLVDSIRGSQSAQEQQQEFLEKVFTSFENTLRNITTNDVEALLDEKGNIAWNKLDRVTYETVRDYFGASMQGAQLEKALESAWSQQPSYDFLAGGWQRTRKEIQDILTPLLRKWMDTTNSAMDKNRSEMDALQKAILDKSASDPIALSRDINHALETNTLKDSTTGASVSLTKAQREYLESIRPAYNTIASTVGAIEKLSPLQQKHTLVQVLSDSTTPETAKSYLRQYLAYVDSIVRQTTSIMQDRTTYSDQEIADEKDLLSKLDMMARNANAANRYSLGDDEAVRMYQQAVNRAYGQLATLEERERQTYARAMADDAQLDSFMRLFYEQYARNAYLSPAAPHILEAERRMTEKQQDTLQAQQGLDEEELETSQ